MAALHFSRERNKLTRAIVTGCVGKPAEIRLSKNGNQFAVFTIRESLNGVTRWWNATTFSETAIEILRELAISEPVAVAGEIGAEIYSPAGSESRINWRVSVHAVLSARKLKRKTEALNKGAPARGAPELARRFVTPAAATGAVPSDDEIPFAPEWR